MGIFLREKNVPGADAFMFGRKYDVKTIKGAGGIRNGVIKSVRSGQATRFIIDARGVDLTKKNFDYSMDKIREAGVVWDELTPIAKGAPVKQIFGGSA